MKFLIFRPQMNIILLFGFLVILLPQNLTATDSAPWMRLDQGLHLAAFDPPMDVSKGNDQIHVLRIDPRHYQLRLLNASNTKTKKSRSARQWARRNDLIAAINASMYQRDNLTSVSYMKTDKHTNSRWFSKDKALLAFDPQSEDLPPAQILDRDCHKVKQLRKQYRSQVQSIRMVSCERENVWQQQPNKKWSTAAIGEDQQGNILFIHSRASISVHDLINHLLQLKPLELKRAMYVEGGPESQLYVNSGKKEWNLVGHFKNSKPGSIGNTIGWPVPNVIGIVKVPSK